MSFIPAKDISRWQGVYQDTSEPIVLIKISGGDDGLYYDSQATNNYNQAIAHGHAFGGYHFAGGTDPKAEANFFVAGMKPLLTGEVPILDWEVSNPNPPAWCDAFIEQVRAACGNPQQGGLLYMNLSTLLAYDWSVPLSKWGLWLADWNNNPDGPAITNHTYVMQQYNDGPNYDHDAWFGTVDQFKKYGWQPVVAAPAPPAPTPPAPVPPVIVTTDPGTIVITTPTGTTTTTTTTGTTTTTVPPVPPKPPVPPVTKPAWKFLVNFLLALIGLKVRV